MTAEPARTAEPTEDEYERFCATVMASARGRWFLAEYARRHRKADTAAVLEALHAVEDMVRARPEPALERMRDELRALAAMVREGQRELAVSGGTISDASKIMALLDLLSERIDYSLNPADDRAPLPLPVAEPARPHLSVVKPSFSLPPNEFDATAPEPIKPAPLPPAARAHVIPLPQPNAPEPPAVVDPDELYVPFAFEPMAQDLPEPPRATLRPNVFADVMALSEAERIALFL